MGSQRASPPSDANSSGGRDLRVKTGEGGIKDTARKRVLVEQESTGRGRGRG